MILLWFQMPVSESIFLNSHETWSVSMTAIREKNTIIPIATRISILSTSSFPVSFFEKLSVKTQARASTRLVAAEMAIITGLFIDVIAIVLRAYHAHTNVVTITISFLFRRVKWGKIK